VLEAERSQETAGTGNFFTRVHGSLQGYQYVYVGTLLRIASRVRAVDQKPYEPVAVQGLHFLSQFSQDEL